jgi:hypothetical protein
MVMETSPKFFATIAATVIAALSYRNALLHRAMQAKNAQVEDLVQSGQGGGSSCGQPPLMNHGQNVPTDEADHGKLPADIQLIRNACQLHAAARQGYKPIIPHFSA